MVISPLKWEGPGKEQFSGVRIVMCRSIFRGTTMVGKVALKCLGRFLMSVGAAGTLLVTGCTQYHTPGGPADLRVLGLGSESAPAAMKMPVSSLVAVVRVQAPEYRSMTRSGVAAGAVSMVLDADSEDAADLQRLGKMYAVRGTIGLNRMVMPAQISGLADLRESARAAGADAMFVYTLDTKFFDPADVGYGEQLRLGVANNTARVETVASGVFLEIKSGQIFGQIQTNAKVNVNADDFSAPAVIDRARKNAERAAFKALTLEAEARWQLAQERAVR